MRPWQAIDHLMLRVERAEPLFDWLHRDLNLPITWPLRHADFATYGWIGIGNTQLEVWAAARNDDLPPGCRLPLVHGFALAPTRLEADLATLRARGVRCRDPRSFASPDAGGVLRPNFTNAVIEDVSSPSCCVFYCDWAAGAPIVPWPPDATPAQRRFRDACALNERRGGTLGITGLQQVTLQAPDVSAAEQAWRKVLGVAHGPLQLAPGIGLAIEAGPRHRIGSLHLGVRDGAWVRAHLAGRQWLGPCSDDGAMRLDAPACAGLSLWLVPDPR